jgi:hypothetical protein
MKLINALNYECSIHLVGCWTLEGYKPSCWNSNIHGNIMGFKQ